MVENVLEWINTNGEAVVTVLAIISASMGLMVKWGWIQKARADALTKKIEDFKGGFSVAMDIAKDKKLTPDEIIALANGTLKSSIKEADVSMAVKAAIADGAAKVDPDPEKKPRPVLRFLGGLVMSRLGIPRP